MLTFCQRFLKRTFDLLISLLILIPFFIPILVIWIIASIDTKSNGFFFQKRVKLILRQLRQ